MAIYLTVESYLMRFGEGEAVRLTDQAGAGLVDEAAIDRAILDIEALIDGYLAGRYALPLDGAPPVLAQIAADLVRERLHGIASPDIVQRRGDAARAQLRDIAAGRLVLPGVAAQASGTMAAPQSVLGANRPFSDGALEGF